MPGRTLMQQALPITFGYKAAVWLSGLTGAAERLRRVEANGARAAVRRRGGTLAALGDKGPRAQGARRAPQAARAGDHLACASAAASSTSPRRSPASPARAPRSPPTCCSSCRRRSARPSSRRRRGKGGSSTMPHKRNPVGAVAIRANHRRIAGLMATIVIGLEQEHERARRRLGGGMGDAARALRASPPAASSGCARCCEGLEVDPARMRENLDAALGLPLAESLMMALAPKIGRAEAQHRVEAASKLALAQQAAARRGRQGRAGDRRQPFRRGDRPRARSGAAISAAPTR